MLFFALKFKIYFYLAYCPARRHRSGSWSRGPLPKFQAAAQAPTPACAGSVPDLLFPVPAEWKPANSVEEQKDTFFQQDSRQEDTL